MAGTGSRGLNYRIRCAAPGEVGPAVIVAHSAAASAGMICPAYFHHEPECALLTRCVSNCEYTGNPVHGINNERPFAHLDREEATE